MKIGLSAINFIPGKIGGTETYFRNLLHQMQLIDKSNDYQIICDVRCAGEFPIFNPGFSETFFDCYKPSLGWLWRGVLRNTIGIDVLQRAVGRLGLDLVHHPFSVLSPAGLKVPSVLTFWDMQHEFYPGFFTAEQLRARDKTYRVSTEQATRIIVSAEFTKRCLVERYGSDPEKIDVIYTGFGPEYHVIDDVSRLNEIKTKYRLDRPFLYYPAATWAHKNHGALLAAVKLLREVHGFDGQLVLTGIAMQSQSEIMTQIASLGLSDTVKVLGYLPYEELPYLYSLAEMMIFPSLFEGFGIPLVEAMACGCPVVCSNATCIPEVVGTAGALFDPTSPEEMAETIWSVWTSDSKRAQMKAYGLVLAKSYNWENTAQKTLAVYRKAV